jgi:ABC-type multidrug transport system fused ATPase/permease subunit
MNTGTIRKLLSIFEKTFKEKALMLQGLLLIGVLFESVGLGMLIPLVTIITDVNAADQNVFVHFIKRFTGNVSNQQLVFIVLGIFTFFYCVKTLFLSYMIWRQTEFTLGLSRNISTRLYKGYLFQPYVFFLDKNSALLMRNVLSEVGSITGYVQAIMYLQTEISVLFGITVTLFLIEPFGASVVFAFVGTVSYLLFFFSKKKLVIWGKQRLYFDGIRSKNVLQGLHGLSELKLFHKENYFVNNFDLDTKQSFAAQRKSQFMQQVQRYYLELVLIVSVMLLSGAVIAQGRTISAILPSLSLFLFAALRMLPSANRIISSLQAMRVSRPSVEMLYEELMLCQRENEKELLPTDSIVTMNQSICFDQVSYSYPSSSLKSLESIDLQIRSGSVVGIIGQSGAGKTTLVNILTGLLKPTAGKILVDDMDITEHMVDFRKQIGYVPQSVFLIDDSLKRNIAFGLDDADIDLSRVHDAIHAAQLDEVVANLPQGIDSLIGERGVKLSGGQKQRIGIARALYNKPSILILDEGTSALDSETEQYIMSSVAKLKGKLTIILVAHRYSTLHFCDIVYKMQGGRIIGKGKLEELV